MVSLYKSRNLKFLIMSFLLLFYILPSFTACSSGLSASNVSTGIATPTPTPTPAPTATPCQFNPTNNLAASLVIGQPNLVSSSANQGLGSPTAATLNSPAGISFVNGRLVVGDTTNSRYLFFNSLPTTNNPSADLVLGQASFSVLSTAVNSSTIGSASEAVWTGDQLILADGLNNRLLVYNTIPQSNGESADYVIGQTDFTGSGNATDASSFNLFTGGLGLDSSKLWVADYNNNRVLRFNLPITSNFPTANLVQGQADLVTAVAGATNKDMTSPSKVIFYENKMIVVERINNRVLVFNSIPTANYIAADVVIGQPDFTSTSINQGLGAATAKTLNRPRGITVDDSGRLYIADTENNRILIYNSIPTANNASADLVLGQSDFISTSINAGASASASSLSNVSDVSFGLCHLVVSDQNNHRVLIFQ